jgi:DNA-binding FadR family transcriptional regulator
MSKSVAERVAEHRRRQRSAGMISVTVVVPQHDARFFRELALSARRKHLPRSRAARPPAREAPRAMSAAQLRIAKRWAAQTGLKLRLTKPGLTLAEVLARSIAHEIVRQGWPLGRNLGTEQQLQQRFASGRNVMREALRKLESQSIVRVRRGEDAGVFVIEPNLEAAAFSAGVYLEFHKLGTRELREARRGMQLLVLEHCMGRLDKAGLAALREALRAEQALTPDAGHHALQRLDVLMAHLTGNPAFELFMDVILRMYRFHSRLPGQQQAHLLADTQALHRALVIAMLRGDRLEARRALLRQLDYLDQRLEAG